MVIKNIMTIIIIFIFFFFSFISLPGNTGTSKAKTALSACNYIKRFIKKNDEKKVKLIRYNLRDETKIDDIIVKYVSEQN